jgi:hypothetical protein
MKVLMKHGLASLYRRRSMTSTYNSKWYTMLLKIEGTILEVDTEYLFQDQFNCITPDGTGIRVMLNDVSAIIGDIRGNLQYCTWCGSHSPKELPRCSKCEKSEYLEPMVLPRLRPTQLDHTESFEVDPRD